MDTQTAESLLRKTFEEIGHQHQARGHAYILRHWSRYVRMVQDFSVIPKGAQVLEIGASILSSLIKRRFGAEIRVVYHEMETEWADRFREEKIPSTALEITRDPLPFDANTFDFILFDQVMEHLPFHPAFVLKQIFRILKPTGTLFLSLPNFAVMERRWDFLFGKNPQDQMDPNFVYFAHHREPVMSEALELVNSCGGRLVHYDWDNCDPAMSFFSRCYQTLRYLRHFEFHRIIPYFVPSTRFYMFIRAAKNPDFEVSDQEMVPPLARTGEFIRHSK